MSDRTVLDASREAAYDFGGVVDRTKGCNYQHHRQMLMFVFGRLGIDPDMSDEDWQPIAAILREHGPETTLRWLRYGQLVEKHARPHPCPHCGSCAWLSYHEIHYLDTIKADPA